jgi:hypothetical protein
MPQLDPAGSSTPPCSLGRSAPIDFGNERRLVLLKELLDDWQTGHESTSEVRKWSGTNNHQ